MDSKLIPSWQGTTTVGGKEIRIETGRIARQADGAVLIGQGETLLLVTAVGAKEPRPGMDFFPLTVEYRGRLSAAGRFPGGYRKREGRISDRDILTCRLVDRTIRPLFPYGYRAEVQVVAAVLSYEPGTDPEALAITGAAAALHLSDIPFDGPVAGLRVVRNAAGEIIPFPDAEQKAEADLDLILSLGPKGLVMAEGLANEVPEADVQRAIDSATKEAKPLFDLMDKARAAVGREKRIFTPPVIDEQLASAVAEVATETLNQALSIAGKAERGQALDSVKLDLLARLAESHPDRQAEISERFRDLEKRLLRGRILEKEERVDGRSPEKIRPIFTEVGVIPRVHGSALFTRGETQALVVTTLGTARDEQEVETLDGTDRENFQLHYAFPPYSVGETRPLRGPGRREIGHGNLAQRAIAPVLPDPVSFPYTIKVESEITESNGSSSMASVCGGCLSLMDAGVPIARPVAGIAMGLISDGEKTVILSDILGVEDHLGDMDFKVAGTELGITAVQLDNKLGSLPPELLARAMAQAREGRLHILGEMARCLEAPRADLAPLAPRIVSMQIGPHRIRDLIGPGGRHIKEIQQETGTTINVTDDGMVRVFATNSLSLPIARRMIQDRTGEPEVDKFYLGRVTGVKDFGCFVRLFEGIEGLVHVSELDEARVRETGDICKEGDEMIVKVLGVEGGKISLSRRAAKGITAEEVENR